MAWVKKLLDHLGQLVGVWSPAQVHGPIPGHEQAPPHLESLILSQAKVEKEWTRLRDDPINEADHWPGAPFNCIHEKADEVIEHRLTIFGSERTVISPVCSRCTLKYYELCSIRCATCDGPIVPGDDVGQARMSSRYPERSEYTHLTSECNEMPQLLHCGQWGPGHLITLHRLDILSGRPDHEVRPEGTRSAYATLAQSKVPITK